jgi:hypothetical protein
MNRRAQKIHGIHVWLRTIRLVPSDNKCFKTPRLTVARLCRPKLFDQGRCIDRRGGFRFRFEWVNTAQYLPPVRLGPSLRNSPSLAVKGYFQFETHELRKSERGSCI